MRRSILLLSAGLAVLSVGTALAQNGTPHNMILFIPDGLRALKVTPETAPAMADLRDKGVNFKNPHSPFPTFTMANASGMATGHYLGDTGTFSNTIYTGYPSAPAGDTVVPFIENNAVLADVDEHFGGDYLNEETILKMARAKGFSTAAIGKVGPTLLFDHTDRADRPGLHSIVIDDSTGGKNGVPLSEEMKAALTKAGLPLTAPSRGDNGKSGDARTPGTLVPNTAQQAYFADAASKVVLPMFKERKKPFVLVFWSRDPDATQHNEGDSLNTLTPGINGPTSLAAIKNADDSLGRIRSALAALGLAETTNIFLTSDHAFSTVSKESETSPAAQASYADVLPKHLPPGFLSLDLAQALRLPVFDPDDKNARISPGKHALRSDGLIGENAAQPEVIVAANGGSDLIYVPSRDRRLALRLITFLMTQDYVSGVFADDIFGQIPGVLPLSAINLKGTSITPVPAIVVNFRSFDTGCGKPLTCSAEI